MLMLCRTKVHDYDKWWQIFASHAEAHRAAGLKLVNLWRCVDDANHVFFLFEVKDKTRAQAFIDAPESATAGEEAGVIDGDYHFVQSDKMY